MHFSYAAEYQTGWEIVTYFETKYNLFILPYLLIIQNCTPQGFGLAPYQEDDASAAEIEAERQKMLREKGKLYPYIALLKEPKFICFCLIIMIGGLGRYGLLPRIPPPFVWNWQSRKRKDNDT